MGKARACTQSSIFYMPRQDFNLSIEARLFFFLHMLHIFHSDQTEGMDKCCILGHMMFIGEIGDAWIGQVVGMKSCGIQAENENPPIHI